MARPNKPWYRASRGQWYVKIDGRLHRLGPDKRQATKRFHELMATRDEGQPPARHDATSLRGLAKAFLDWCAIHRAPRTREGYLQYLNSFDEYWPALLVSDMRPYHVSEWLDAHPTWGPTTKHNGATCLKRCMRWAAKLGYIPASPIADFEKPTAVSRTDTVSDEEFKSLLEHANARFADLLTVARDTGARPFELCRLEARHLDLPSERAVIPPAESKGRRRARVLYFTDRSVAILQRLAEKHPDGPLFRNARGNAWTAYAIGHAFGRLAKFTGRRVSMYQFRHRYITAALLDGMDSHSVAKLAGHVDGTMLSRVYSHVEKDLAFMQAQARRAAAAPLPANGTTKEDTAPKGSVSTTRKRGRLRHLRVVDVRDEPATEQPSIPPDATHTTQ